MFDSIFNWLGGLLTTLKGFFQHVFDYIKRTVIPFIIRRYQSIEKWLNKHMKPIVDRLKQIRTWYYKHIYRIQRKILDVISGARVALAVFRALGFKWAAKLDADLQKLQSWVTQSILDIIKPLNALSSYMSLILDPGLVLRKDFFRSTLFSDLAGLKRATAYGNGAPLTAEQQQRQQNNRDMLDPSVPVGTWHGDGSFTPSPQFAEMFANGDRALPDYLQ